MQMIVDWMAGVERDFDGKAMGFKNKPHSALKFLAYSLALVGVGVVIGTNL